MARLRESDLQGYARRYPRLLAVVQWVGLLSTGEASSALRDHAHGYGHLGCEAVMHVTGGRGATEIIRMAWRRRHDYRRYIAAWRRECGAPAR